MLLRSEKLLRGGRGKPSLFFCASRCAGPLLLGLVLLTSPGCRKEEDLARLPDDPTGATLRKVRTTTVRKEVSSEIIHATGTATALSTTKVMPLVPGLIRSIPVREGDVLEKGQTLAVLDRRTFQLQLRQAQAAVEAARVAVDATRREKQRFETLLKEDATARAQYEQINDRYQGAQVGMKQALVALDMAKKSLTDSVLRSPYRGVVVKKLASVGDYATSMPPTVLMVLMEITTLELQVSLAEPELPRVKEGAEVEARFPSIERTVQAKVSRIVRSVDVMTRSFIAIVEIDNADLSLKPGLFARVAIKASQPRQRLLVAEEAVVDEGNGVYAVYVAREGRARRRLVRVTSGEEKTVEIISGIEGGETVILDAAGLMDGDPIQVRAADARAARPAGPGGAEGQP